MRVGTHRPEAVPAADQVEPFDLVHRASLRLAALLAGLGSPGGVDIAGIELMPKTGPLLVCCNHMSNFDPLVLESQAGRPLHAMTKSELFSVAPLAWFLRRCQCFPVRRGRPDRQAMRQALDVLSRGGALLLFPEGHRTFGGGMLPFNQGAGYLALQSRAPVLPCAIWGTEGLKPRGRRMPRRSKVHVRCGPPFQVSGPTAKAAAEEIQRKVAALLPPSLGRLAD